MSDDQPNQPDDRTTEARLDYLLPLPTEAMPLTAVEVVEYIDGDGDHAYGFRVQGTQSPAQVAGLLELVKSRFLDQANYGNAVDM